MSKKIQIIGAGLAGCEAALTLSAAGRKVELYDIKPDKFLPAHSNPDLAELVCSNSLKSDELTAASGLLKAELRLLSSPLIAVADTVKVPAGGALAVDRGLFAASVTKLVEDSQNIDFRSGEIDDWDPESFTIIATGPLTAGALAANISQKLGSPMYFYDAAAPIIFADSIDMSRAFSASRYKEEAGDYINCPMDKEEYGLFWESLISAERAPLKDFETAGVFEGCMPVEVMASRGKDTLRFGPLRPVGITDPVTGMRPYAVVQLRKENTAGDMYNLVGFQTNLKFGEQKRVFGMIPALKDAEYARYGVMHRNSYINAPETIDCFFRALKYPSTFIAGQLCGVEGYVESMASGHIAALNIDALLSGRDMYELPAETILGALQRQLTVKNKNFQPINSSFGLLPDLGQRIKDKKLKRQMLSERALSALSDYIISSGLAAGSRFSN